MSVIPDLIEGKSRIAGRGVFAGRRYTSGDLIFDFMKPPPAFCHRDDLPMGKAIALQVSHDIYLLASGAIDDYFNHSCDPNAAVIIRGGTAILRAIRPIKPMEEITFDYSLTMVDNPLEIPCRCGVPACRKVVREYRTLPAEVRHRYEHLKIVPEYVLFEPAKIHSDVKT